MLRRSITQACLPTRAGVLLCRISARETSPRLSPYSNVALSCAEPDHTRVCSPASPRPWARRMPWRAYRRGPAAAGAGDGTICLAASVPICGPVPVGERGVSAGSVVWRTHASVPGAPSSTPVSTTNAAIRPGPCGSSARSPRTALPQRSSPPRPHYRQALALAEELGMRPLQAHCHRGLGTLYATLGQQEQARVELSAAIDLYRAMDMNSGCPRPRRRWRSR